MMSTEIMESNQPTKQAPRFSLDAYDCVNVFKELEELMVLQGLDTKSPKVQIVGKTHDTVGTDNAAVSSITRYEHIYPGFLDFCFLIKDYESAMIAACEHCPKDWTLVKVDMAIMYLRFYCIESGKVLTHTATHATVYELHGSSETPLPHNYNHFHNYFYGI